MEHEAAVPLPAAAVRRALREPAALARCLPGFAADAAGSGETLSGRLKLRIGNSSITYRGELYLAFEPDGALLVRVDAQQAVGEGAVTGIVRAEARPDGEQASRLVVRCELVGKGRVTELDAEAVRGAGRRLLDRFATALAADPYALIGEQPGEPPAEALPQPDDVLPPAGGDFPEPDYADHLASGAALPSEAEGFDGAVEEPWPDAAPHRRSLLGPSAEEVDHAPPRGRYAPALPARSARSRAAARWGGGERRLGEPPYVRTPGTERNLAPLLLAATTVAVTAAVVIRRFRGR